VRAMLEGVALGLRDSFDLIAALGVDLRTGRASGGGARSTLWLRIVASALGIPVERPQVEEGAAYGAALLAGVAAGVYADPAEAVRTCVSVRDTIDPEPAWVDAYADARERFRALYPALRAAADGSTMTLTACSSSRPARSAASASSSP
jgi:xylulokinase